MAKKPKVLGEEEILTKVLSKSRESVGWFDSRLSLERERILRYRNGELPRRQHEGSSSYVSTDVYDAVEACSASLLETFGAGEDIAQFDADQDMGADACAVATAYARYVIFRQNPGFSIFDSVIHDGLEARAGVCQVSWDDSESYSEEKFDNIDPIAAHGLAARDDVHEFDGTLDQQTGGYSGTLTRKKSTSQVRLEAVPPEEFLITPRSVDIESAAYVGRRTLKTRDELLKMGYDKAKVKLIHWDDSRSLAMAPEVLARNRPIEAASAVDNPVTPEMEQVEFYESYVKMVIDKSKGGRLYKICHAGSVLLTYDEVDKRPFIAYVPLPRPHMFYGDNFAARVIPFQNARTVLIRGVLDHTSITNNPRWQVVKGGLLNPRELIENKLGGIVNVARPDTLAPLGQNPMNPYVFNVLTQLKDDKEQSTGISALSQGLNKDAISTQNSKGLIDNMVSLSTQRQKIAARNFAYNFLAPLMIEVIRLTILNEDGQKVIQVAGKPLQIDPKTWTERTSCTVSMHLGYGEKDEAAGKLKVVYESLAQDPSLQNVFTLPHKVEMIRDGMKLMGIHKNYLDDPATAPPVQPDPMKAAEVQAKAKLADAAQTQAQAATAKVQNTAQYDQAKLTLDRVKLALEGAAHDRENDRHDLEATARVDVAQREMKLEESMPAQQRHATVNPRP